MIKILTLIAATSLTFNAMADDTQFIAMDNSKDTSKCISAAQNGAVKPFQLRAIGLSQYDIDTVQCNGKPISEFAREHLDSQSSRRIELVATSNDQDTLLCIAAAESNERWREVAPNRLQRIKHKEFLRCNGEELESFAKSHGNRKFRV